MFQLSTFPLISPISKAFSGEKDFWKWSPMRQPQKVNLNCCLEHFYSFPCIVLVLLYFGLPRFNVLTTLSCSVYQNQFTMLNCGIMAIVFQPLDKRYGRIKIAHSQLLTVVNVRTDSLLIRQNSSFPMYSKVYIIIL